MFKFKKSKEERRKEFEKFLEDTPEDEPVVLAVGSLKGAGLKAYKARAFLEVVLVAEDEEAAKKYLLELLKNLEVSSSRAKIKSLEEID